jgi:CubicO group peptidase (beta-lactamase class C family)
MSRSKITRSALLVLLVLLSSRELCDFAQANDSSQSWPTKEWQTSTPEEQGMDSAALAQLVNFVGIYKQDSLLIIRHGKIVVDAYYAPYAPNIRHDLRSVTKSFIGTPRG